MSSLDYCALFPGQGAITAIDIKPYKNRVAFEQYYRPICNKLGFDIFQEAQAIGNEFCLQNHISSVLVALTSILDYQAFIKNHQRPACVAGYSVGQWVALYIAGVLPYEQLLDVIITRARLMDACFVRAPGSMIAIIGVHEVELVKIITALQSKDIYIQISNYNSIGQYTLALHKEDVAYVIDFINANAKVRKICEIPVSGAWHCSLLKNAGEEFLNYLHEIEFSPMRLPVADNVTGGYLPSESQKIRSALSQHIYHPVMWQKCIENIIKEQVKNFIEFGVSNTLTKFGMFIDRESHFYHCEKAQYEYLLCEQREL